MLEVMSAYVFFGLALIPVTVYFNQFLFFVFAFYVAARKFHKKPQEPLKHYPGVSIIKPLMGVDPLLRENLVSHLEIQYPNLEIVFCVEAPNDPAIELVHSLFREYPNVDARIIIGGNGNIINPMVNNFLPGYESAKYSLVWVSTSRIRANTDIILDMVRKSESPDVALVHQLPYFVDQRGFLNVLEKICFGCSLGRSSIALNHMGMLCFTGMSYIVKKPILDKYGGFARFGKFLAEDFFLSKELFENGYKIVMSDIPAQQNVSNANIDAYVSRMVRWLRLRLNMLTVVAVFFEPMIECLNLGVLISLSLNYFFLTNIPLVFLMHVCAWISIDYMLLKCVQNGPLPFSFFTFLLAWWTRELLTYVIYVRAVWHPRTVKWGPNTYSLSLGGHTNIFSGPSSDNKLIAYSPEELNSSTSLVHSKAVAAVNPTFSNMTEKLFELVSPATQMNNFNPESKTLLNTGAEFTWRHFPQNGYIRGTAESVRRLEHIGVNAAFMSDA